jgi:hypothetical protein
LDDVQLYIDAIGGLIPAEEFVDANERGGWTYGGGNKPVIDWKAHYRTWNSKRAAKMEQDSGCTFIQKTPTLEEARALMGIKP